MSRAEELGLDLDAFEMARNVFIGADGKSRVSDRLAEVIWTYVENAVITMDGGGP